MNNDKEAKEPNIYKIIANYRMFSGGYMFRLTWAWIVVS